MDAVTNQQPSGPRPIPLESAKSISQETMSAQSRLQWHQSSQGRNEVLFKTVRIHNKIYLHHFSFLFFLTVPDSTGSRFRMVSRSDHVMYTQQMMMAPPAAQTIQQADPIVSIRVLKNQINNRKEAHLKIVVIM